MSCVSFIIVYIINVVLNLHRFMKVLFVPPMAFPLEIGGFQHQVRQIFDGLKSRGIEVDWYNLILTNIRDYDIVHFHSISSAFIPICHTAKSLGIPVVITPMFGSRKLSDNKLKMINLISNLPYMFVDHKSMRELISSATHLVTLTQFEKDRFARFFNVDLNNISIIGNGIDESFFSQPCSNVEIPLDNYILIVGRIEHNKNQESIIKIAKKEKYNLLIVGEKGIGSESYTQNCKKIAEGSESIVFWGAEKDREVMKAIYQKAKMTVIPSFSEMYPLVALESLSQNTAVLCTNRCGLYPKTMDGLFYTSPEYKILEKKITEVYDKAEIPITKKIDSWLDIADQHIILYESILA